MLTYINKEKTKCIHINRYVKNDYKINSKSKLRKHTQDTTAKLDNTISIPKISLHYRLLYKITSSLWREGFFVSGRHKHNRNHSQLDPTKVSVLYK